jgi:hypothetical protein
VTTEYDLIEAELALANYLHIDVGNKNVEDLKRVYDNSYIPYPELNQWRIMVFFDQIDDITELIGKRNMTV